MAKKKSSTQKPKTPKKTTAPKVEKEIKKLQKNKTKKVESTETKEVKKEEKTTLNKYQKAYQNKNKTTKKKAPIKKEVVETKEVEEPKEIKIKYIGLKEYIALRIKNIKKALKRKKKHIDPKKAKELEKEKRRQEYKERLILNQQLEKKVQKIEKDYSKHNIVVRTLVKIYRNLHIVFNSILLISFIILLIGAFKTEVYSTSSIIYFGVLALFLIVVAISQNKYLSGKVFSIILTTIMVLITAKLQYTYDFIRILNTSSYEYKTYYVVAIDNNINRSIYNINNKKVGVLEEVSEKTSRVLEMKIQNVNYQIYKDNNELFEDFYSQKFRAVIVNENQLKYLENNPNNSKKIKTLYEFKAITKK